MRMLHLGQLTPEAEKLLSGVGSSSNASYEEWQKVKVLIANQDAQLFLCPDNTYLVLQVDRDSLVVLALVGRNGVAIMQTLVSVAYSMGLKFVWYRTQRPGMLRLLKQFNPVPYENGYRVNV